MLVGVFIGIGQYVGRATWLIWCIRGEYAFGVSTRSLIGCMACPMRSWRSYAPWKLWERCWWTALASHCLLLHVPGIVKEPLDHLGDRMHFGRAENGGHLAVL